MNTASSIRYKLEQRELPKLYYTDRAGFLFKMIGSQGSTIMDLYHREEAANQDYHCPYSEAEFLESHTVYHAKDGETLVLRVQMPEPEDELLCRAVYLCFAQDSSDLLFFTSEKTKGSTYNLCARAKNGMHLCFGDAPERIQDEFDLAAELFERRHEIQPLGFPS